MKARNDLLSVFSDEHCGDNLEYSAEFLALEKLVQGKPEQQFGETIIEAQEPEWHQVEKTALAISEKTLDIRVLSCLTWAWVAQHGMSGYAQGLSIIETALEKFWPVIHPRLIDDGFEDAMPRINALVALSNPQGMIKTLRQVPMLSSSYGTLSLRDVVQVLDGTRDDDFFPGGRLRLSEILGHAYTSGELNIVALFNAVKSLNNIVQKVEKELGHEWIPDFSAVQHLLKGVIEAINNAQSQQVDDSDVEVVLDEVVSSEKESQLVSSIKSVNWRDVSLKSRQDVMLVLEKVSTYFEIYEPSHPAPFLIKRVQQIVPLNFYEILQNLTPNAVDQFDGWMPKTTD